MAVYALTLLLSTLRFAWALNLKRDLLENGDCMLFIVGHPYENVTNENATFANFGLDLDGQIMTLSDTLNSDMSSHPFSADSLGSKLLLPRPIIHKYEKPSVILS